MTAIPITVIGIDDRPLTAKAAGRLTAATLVVGASRHLAAMPISPAAQQVSLGDVGSGLTALADHQAAGNAGVVLASGDPGFFGIVRLLTERELAFDVFPAVSSVATLFARAGVRWDDAVV